MLGSVHAYCIRMQQHLRVSLIASSTSPSLVDSPHSTNATIMKVITTLAAALVSPVSAIWTCPDVNGIRSTCCNRGEYAGDSIVESYGCFPPPSLGTNDDTCPTTKPIMKNLSSAETYCNNYIDNKYLSYCVDAGVTAPSAATMKSRCGNAVNYLEDGKQKVRPISFASAEGSVVVALLPPHPPFVCSLTPVPFFCRPEDSGAEEEADCECEGRIEFNTRST